MWGLLVELYLIIAVRSVEVEEAARSFSFNQRMIASKHDLLLLTVTVEVECIFAEVDEVLDDVVADLVIADDVFDGKELKYVAGFVCVEVVTYWLDYVLVVGSVSV